MAAPPMTEMSGCAKPEITRSQYLPGAALDPLQLLSALATAADQAGLIAIASTTYSYPWDTARRLACWPGPFRAPPAAAWRRPYRVRRHHPARPRRPAPAGQAGRGCPGVIPGLRQRAGDSYVTIGCQPFRWTPAGCLRGRMAGSARVREASDDIVLRVLGPVAVRAQDGWQGGPPQQRLILAVLALQAGQVVPAHELIDAVWEERPPRSARASLQALVTRLRQLVAGLPGGQVERRGEGYRLRLGAGLTDVQRFRSLARAGREAGDSQTAAAVFDEALSLWRGPALADVPDTASVDAIRAGLAQERLSARQDRLAALLDLGRDQEAAGELAALLAGHPLAERLAGMLMIALYRCGRRGDALQVFRDMRGRLAGQLGVEPGPDLQRLHQRILAGDPAAEIPSGAPARPPVARPAAVAGAGLLALPRQLPAAVTPFTGRTAELEALSRLLEDVPAGGGAVVISAIGGTAGVGKTALAVHWAHHVAGRFPDGQLYANLRGFGPTGAPVSAADAVRGFLGSLGLPQDRIPDGLDAQAALYRSMLAGKRVLIVLDNAGDEEQVRPLLPGSAGCLVLVTSRRSLAGLAAQGAHQITLDVMSEAEARELLAARLGASRAAAEPAAVTELAALCARLPLALAVAAVRAAASPGFPLSSLAEQLRDMPTRLDALAAQDQPSSVRAVFSWSHKNLSDPAARMFGLLGLHAGPDITAAAAASLAGIGVREASQALAELSGAHLMTEQLPGRFSCHDLLRAYAIEVAHAQENAAGRRAAIRRVLDHYLHTAWCAGMLIMPGREPALALARPQPGTTPEALRDGEDALGWCRAEHQVLLAAIAQAVANGFDVHAWQLPWALADYFFRAGHWQTMADAHRTALSAGRRLGDRAAQARAHHGLGYGLLMSSPGQSGHQHLTQALGLYRELGDPLGQANAHLALAVALLTRHRPRPALGHAWQALGLARAAGHRREEAAALNLIGWLYAGLGDYRLALPYCQRALGLYCEDGDQLGQAATWDSIGYIHHHLGDYGQAAACYQHALQRADGLGSHFTQAEILDHLGTTREAAGDPQAARDAWRQALGLLNDLRHPGAGDLRRKLREMQAHPLVPAAEPLRVR
jgi:DNA-binding SARP family transcriptional activator